MAPGWLSRITRPHRAKRRRWENNGESYVLVRSLPLGSGDQFSLWHHARVGTGIGVAFKVTMMTGMVCIGLAQGVQPLLGYCVGAKLKQRYRKCLRFSLVFAFVLSAVLTVLCYVFTAQIVGVFLTDQSAYDYAFEFARILLSTSFLFGLFYVLLNALQSMGASTASLIVNLSRQGLIYIPALFVLQAALGMTGLLWAQPVADVLSLVLAIFLYRRVSKRQWGDKPVVAATVTVLQDV